MESGVRILTATDLQNVTPAKSETFGAVGMTADGRRYRYVGFGGTATINAGLLVVAAAKTANSNALAITAVGTNGQLAANLLAGSTNIVITNGSTAVTQDQFADGFLEVLWSGGAFAVRINGNTAAAAAGAITVTLAPGGLVNSAALVPGTDTVNLTASPFANVAPSLTQSAPIGFTVAQVVNTASVANFGWVQTNGHAIVSATTAVKGQGFTQDNAGTAGFIKTTSAATDSSFGFAKEGAANSTASVEIDLPS